MEPLPDHCADKPMAAHRRAGNGRNGISTTTTSHERAAFLRGLLTAMPGNGTAVQRRRIRAALSRGPLSTIEAARWLDCYDPPRRVFELRHNDGVRIELHWTWQLTEAGEPHRVGVYVLGVKP